MPDTSPRAVIERYRTGRQALIDALLYGGTPTECLAAIAWLGSAAGEAHRRREAGKGRFDLKRHRRRLRPRVRQEDLMLPIALPQSRRTYVPDPYRPLDPGSSAIVRIVGR